MVLSDLIERIRGEDPEKPGLRLTGAQTQRLWRLDRRACEQLLQRLVEDRFLPGGDEDGFVRDPARSRV